ncbi:hypothetical protein D187_005593 [Cystobacter fuscus DSM 2262]|uniref:Uncharacterized protein n=1 Tax=Cystobacter fuscus (strain ATCC 25194 / DSM 2262 / NBRC 100088 / M29) TaxID=1242864 RepID=S9QT35_CYSF2|nr:hypothetical protein D187_005593 [Cystobacter fuscus DSM 2262]
MGRMAQGVALRGAESWRQGRREEVERVVKHAGAEGKKKWADAC